jgi:riboflavin kinase / FMN adenylyltransferase
VIVLRDGDDPAPPDRPSVVTIGVFDGLHRGHQRVIEQVRALARGHEARATVVTFDPHPALVLYPERAPKLLMTLGQRLEGLEALGVDAVRILAFDEAFSRQTPGEFVERVLVGELDVRDVVVGEDFKFGHDRAGDVAFLVEQGRRHGFGVQPALIYNDGQRWSSTAVRAALANGDLARATTVLGRPFTLRGEVVHGAARGEALGFPTANLALAERQQLPELGIYAGAVRTPDATWWPAAISVGTRPQFYDDAEALVEVHVAGYRDDLYGATLDVSFLERLRGEMKFDSVAGLVDQIERDVVATLEVFKTFSAPG